MNEISASAVESLDGRLRKEAEEGGYHLNPDEEFTKALVRGLLINEERYGYPACPCRLASGLKEEDLDIICPCDYRDADVNEWGMCYCALYVSGEVSEGKRELEGSIDERRPSEEERGKTLRSGRGLQAEPLWRCRVCGYLCARSDPPETCPICRAKKDRFEPFL